MPEGPGRELRCTAAWLMAASARSSLSWSPTPLPLPACYSSYSRATGPERPGVLEAKRLASQMRALRPERGLHRASHPHLHTLVVFAATRSQTPPLLPPSGAQASLLRLLLMSIHAPRASVGRCRLVQGLRGSWERWQQPWPAVGILRGTQSTWRPKGTLASAASGTAPAGLAALLLCAVLTRRIAGVSSSMVTCPFLPADVTTPTDHRMALLVRLLPLPGALPLAPLLAGLLLGSEWRSPPPLAWLPDPGLRAELSAFATDTARQ